MEVAIIKRETTGSGPNTFHDNETIAKWELHFISIVITRCPNKF